MLFLLRRFACAKGVVWLRRIKIPRERMWLVPTKIRPDVGTALAAGGAHETRRLKVGQPEKVAALLGALSLYLNFLNLSLMMLRVASSRRALIVANRVTPPPFSNASIRALIHNLDTV